MSILSILTFPNEILKKNSDPIPEVNDEIRKLLDDMLETMYAARGVGLAAIQVGVAKRALILDLKKDDEVKRSKGFYPLYLINPEIMESSAESVEDFEGCLSVPNQRAKIKRSLDIKLRYLDYHGNQQVLDAQGWLARVIQHEMDHLDGKLFIDRLSKLKKDMIINKIKKPQKA